MARKAPELMFEHGVDAKKGWFEMAALDFQAKIDPNIEFDLPPGRIVHLYSCTHDEGGKPKPIFRPGCHTTGPAMTAINGSASEDVSNPGTTAGGLFMHKAIMPGGEMTGLVHLAGLELETTEFDKDQTYVSNELLTARQGIVEAAEDYAGVLTNQRSGGGAVRAFQESVCGIVSTGEHVNHNRVSTLAYWSYHLPGTVY